MKNNWLQLDNWNYWVFDFDWVKTKFKEKNDKLSIKIS